MSGLEESKQSLFSGKRILYAGSFTKVAEEIGEILKYDQVEVWFEVSARLAYKKILDYQKTTPFNLIIISDELFEDAELNLVQVLKAIPATRHIPLMLLGEGNSRKGEFECVIQGPYEAKKVIEAINNIFSRRFGETQKSENAFSAEDFKILLVEDNDINIMLVKKVMDMHHMKCDVAKNGKEAVEICKINKYDIILMDYHMPVMDGCSATLEIRNGDGLNRESIIVAMTGSALPKEIDKCFKAGMNHYLSKPLDINMLLNMINDYKKARR